MQASKQNTNKLPRQVLGIMAELGERRAHDYAMKAVCAAVDNDPRFYSHLARYYAYGAIADDAKRKLSGTEGRTTTKK